MSSSRIVATLLCAGLLSAAQLRAGTDASEQPVPADEASLLIESLRAGLHQWEREVGFKASYIARAGKARSLADPKTGKIEPLQVTIQGSGVLIKDGPNLRQSIDFSIGGLQVASPLPADGSRPSTYQAGGVRPVHQLSTESATIFYHPRVPVAGTPGWQVGGSAHLLESTPDQQGELAAARFPGIVTPLSPSPKAGMPVSKLLDRDALLAVDDQSSIERQIYRKQRDQIEVVTTTPKQTVRLIFWTAPFPPVLKAIYKENRQRPNLGTYRYRSILSDFRQCQNGMAPARIVATSTYDSEPLCNFKEWVSADLGDQPAEPSDFQLDLPPDAFIGGMTELPPVENGVRPIRIDGLRQDRVAALPQNVAEIIDPSAPPLEPISPPGNNRIMFLIVFNSIAIGGAALYVSISRRRQAGRHRE